MASSKSLFHSPLINPHQPPCYPPLQKKFPAYHFFGNFTSDFREWDSGAQTAGTHRCGEAVIGRRADSCTTALGLSLRESWPLAVCCTVPSPQNAAGFFLTNGLFTGSVQVNLYQGIIDRTARASVLLPFLIPDRTQDFSNLSGDFLQS